MNIKSVIHEEDGGGYWAEVPAIPGCATQGETTDELLANLREAIEGCLSVDAETPHPVIASEAKQPRGRALAAPGLLRRKGSSQ
jgi:predicted RNase H-like HicB family nuclease